jgi:activator of HSP90 ATPase
MIPGAKHLKTMQTMRRGFGGAADSALTRRRALIGAALAAGGLVLGPRTAWAQTDDGVVRTAEAIHQEPTFAADRSRVFEALADEHRFDAVVRLSPDMHELMGPGTAATRIVRSAGGELCLFGGHIVGLNIELVPESRLVQAWRVVDWPPGVFSIARFELVAEGSGTRIVFDHQGFPQGAAGHLAAGWKAHYWLPLKTYLG